MNKDTQEEKQIKHKRSFEGKVMSVSMKDTVIVEVFRFMQHPIYHKTIKRSSRFAAHVSDVTPKVGDVVKIEEIKPMSKTKHFKVASIVTSVS